MEHKKENMKGSTSALGIDDLEGLLDKMLSLRKMDKQPSFLRRVMYIAGAICGVSLTVFIALILYKKDSTVESILSTLLAFFSMFISIFFYFKADEASSKFYDSSYKFMKDISVTLGKIEERFGEKLNSLSDKISHFDKESKAVTEEIEDKEEDRTRFISDILEKGKYSREEMEQYKRQIEEKDREIERLRRQRMAIEGETIRLNHKLEQLMAQDKVNELSVYNKVGVLRNILPYPIIDYMLRTGKLPQETPKDIKRKLISMGIIDSEDNVDFGRCVTNLED